MSEHREVRTAPGAPVTSAARGGPYDAVIIGRGISGMYQLHRLRGLGLPLRVFEAATASAAPGTEPLPRGALRFRELDLRPPSPRDPARVGVERALRRRSRDPALRTSSPTSAISAVTSSSIAGSSAAYDEAVNQWEIAERGTAGGRGRGPRSPRPGRSRHRTCRPFPAWRASAARPNHTGSGRMSRELRGKRSR